MLLAQVDPQPPCDVNAVQGPALEGKEGDQPLNVARQPDRLSSHLELEPPEEAEPDPLVPPCLRTGKAAWRPQRRVLP